MAITFRVINWVMSKAKTDPVDAMKTTTGLRRDIAFCYIDLEKLKQQLYHT